MITITGATGNVGSVVATELITAGHDVRVTTRSADRAAAFEGKADIAVIDFDNRESIITAFAGADEAFIGMGTTPDQVAFEKALVDAAVVAEVGHIVKLSVMGASADFPVVIQEYHTEIEAHLAGSGVPYSILRPATFFPAVITTPAPFITAETWGGNTAGGRAAFIDTDDVGVFGARVILNGAPMTGSQIFELTGPESLTMEQVALAISQQLGIAVDYQQRSDDEQAVVLEAAGLPPYYVNVLLGLDRMTRDNIMATVTPVFEDVVGRAPRTAHDWLRTADLSPLAALNRA